jgi:hypothetical protein
MIPLAANLNQGMALLAPDKISRWAWRCSPGWSSAHCPAKRASTYPRLSE